VNLGSQRTPRTLSSPRVTARWREKALKGVLRQCLPEEALKLHVQVAGIREQLSLRNKDAATIEEGDHPSASDRHWQ